MRISDWSSDVCSSDLFDLVAIARLLGAQHRSNSLDRLPRIAPLALHSRLIDWINVRNAVNHFGLLGMEFVGVNITKADNRAVFYHDRVEALLGIGAFRIRAPIQLGRASLRARRCPYVSLSVCADPGNQNNMKHFMLLNIR